MANTGRSYSLWKSKGLRVLKNQFLNLACKISIVLIIIQTCISLRSIFVLLSAVIGSFCLLMIYTKD